MTPIEVIQDIQKDCANDARNLDGKPFNGRVVAEQFGATLAMLQAVAKLVEDGMRRLDALEQAVRPVEDAEEKGDGRL